MLLILEQILPLLVFLKNKLIFTDFIGLGGIHITSDIVKGLGTESDEAEKIKIMHGSLDTTESDDFVKIKIPIISENGELISHEIPKVHANWPS